MWTASDSTWWEFHFEKSTWGVRLIQWRIVLLDYTWGSNLVDGSLPVSTEKYKYGEIKNLVQIATVRLDCLGISCKPVQMELQLRVLNQRSRRNWQYDWNCSSIGGEILSCIDRMALFVTLNCSFAISCNSNLFLSEKYYWESSNKCKHRHT